MGHKAGPSFFKKKKSWSERKDEILRCYLPPYLAKIASLPKKIPILIVDAFAGPGIFEDGNAGSPIIICNAVNEAISRRIPVPVSVMCIEQVSDLHEKLKNSISEFPFAKASKGNFLDYIDTIESEAKTHSVFLYVDPFTVEGLDLKAMDDVFRHLTLSRMSVEILLNFNSPIFARCGLSALKLTVPDSNPEIEDAEPIDANIEIPPSIEKLNTIVGGEWWQDILKTDESFPQKVDNISNGVCRLLSMRFKEVCKHSLKALPHHTVPKYDLIFASRSQDALLLMNNEMVKSQRTLADLAKPVQPELFENRPIELIPDFEILPDLILKHTSKPKQRKQVIIDIVRENFCQFAQTEIRGSIEHMLKTGKLNSASGKTRINDQTKIWENKGGN